MEKPYTHTSWRVRAGSEDEFVRRWIEWVDWSHREGLEAPALLLRDLENPQAFISFGLHTQAARFRSRAAAVAAKVTDPVARDRIERRLVELGA